MTVALKDESDLYTWQVTLAGPASSVYEGGTYAVLLTLPTDYPFKPPNVRILTRIYHPNITNDSLGNICLSILKPENWKPATKVSAVLEAVRQLLVEPQPDDPLESRIADEYRNDRKEFENTARQYVTRYAQGPPSFSDASPASSKSK